MRHKFLIAFAIAAPTSGISMSDADAQEHQCASGRTRIVGGEPAALANWPGLATFRVKSQTSNSVRYFCGGTAIADRWILSAAHCFEDELPRDASGRFGRKLKSPRLEVVLGAADLRSTTPADVYGIEQVVMHEGYQYRAAPGMGNDIALVRLDRPWSGASARLSLSLSADPATPPTAQVRVAGFGSVGTSWTELKSFSRTDGQGQVEAGSATLLETAIETIATDRCYSAMKQISTVPPVDPTIGPGQICAGLEDGGKDACAGDSGGPLVMTDERGCPWQIGLVSWGSAHCGHKGTYGVYTRVSHFADWIQKHTGPLQGAPPLAVAAVGHSLTGPQSDEGLRQLQDLLGKAKGRVSIGIRGGNRVRLGADVVFEAASDTAGKLVILDINANREVLLLYPNKFVPAAQAAGIGPGQRVMVPGPDYPGFTAFRAVEPVGKGRLLALVVPQDFDVGRFAAATAHLSRGFQAVNDPPSYLMRVIRQVEMALSLRTRSGEDELKRWGYAVGEYEIVR
jgi:secreted trypsin-like serine protease